VASFAIPLLFFKMLDALDHFRSRMIGGDIYAYVDWLVFYIVV
jgi:hypothetical protein